MRIGSLFSGAKGLDMAVEAVFGETAWHCEIDPGAAKVLTARWPDVPNLGDITKVDWEQIEPVDIVCGGWPCQPFSSAGLKKGAADERALWPEVARAVRILRPRIIVLENVSTVVVLGELARAVGDLASLGYDAQWVCLRAADIGAPHRRERVFILATDTGRGGLGGSAELNRPQVADSEAGAYRRHVDRCGVETARGDMSLLPTPTCRDYKGGCVTVRDGDRRRPVEISDLTVARGEGGASDLATAAELLVDDWGPFKPAIHAWERATRPAPPCAELGSRGKPRLNPAFSEWMMGWPKGWVTEVPGISRKDQLRLIGNGVVPQQAAAALTYLLSVCEVAA